ncbi:hypothetical protein SASPL_108671 [Salvia splendens]|uniref:Uncharacterized protein n=1 Tax=Salvia splendens TaxID=180675 RepID=A0A8X9A7N9_SALSN|nr:hypothetical protein SASPL_108671 [Salvia splendens]
MVDEQIDIGSDDVAVIGAVVESEVTSEQLVEAVEAVRLHHLRHRRSEIEERIVGIDGRDFDAVVVAVTRLFEDGPRLAWIEEEAIGLCLLFIILPQLHVLNDRYS